VSLLHQHSNRPPYVRMERTIDDIIDMDARRAPDQRRADLLNVSYLSDHRYLPDFTSRHILQGIQGRYDLLCPVHLPIASFTVYG
jgi:hypothetical protein